MFITVIVYTTCLEPRLSRNVSFIGIKTVKIMVGTIAHIFMKPWMPLWKHMNESDCFVGTEGTYYWTGGLDASPQALAHIPYHR